MFRKNKKLGSVTNEVHCGFINNLNATSAFSVSSDNRTNGKHQINKLSSSSRKFYVRKLQFYF